MMDGNFAAQHQAQKRPELDVWFADGHGCSVTVGPYREHLRTAVQIKQVRVTSFSGPLISQLARNWNATNIVQS